MAFTGPIHLPTRDGLDDKGIRANLTFATVLNSNGSAVIAGYVASSDVTACSDWTSFASTYQEYRVLGFEVKYANHYNGAFSTTVIQRTGAMCTNHVSTISSPTTLDEVVQAADHKPWRTAAPLTITWRARGTEELAFTPTSATSTHGGVKYYSDVGTPSVAYGVLFVTFCVEFRSRK